MELLKIKKLAEEKGIPYKEGMSLSSVSSYRIGGESKISLFPEKTEDLIYLISSFKQSDISFHIFGNASNVLFPDSGLENPVIFTTSMTEKDFCEDNVISAECGVSLGSLSLMAQNNCLSGLEFAYGIPGTVGGAVYMNAGAYGGCIGDVILSSTVYDVETGKITELDSGAHNYGYRKSVFINNNNYVILSSRFALNRGDKDGIKKIMNENMQKRRDKQPLEYPSCGSVFKRYPGYYTGKLIEDAGLKGKRIGGAMVSEKHAGFIINYDNATAHDVISLIDLIKEIIRKEHGIELETEVKIITE